MKRFKAKIITALIVLGTVLTGVACKAEPHTSVYSFADGRAELLSMFPGLKSLQDTTLTLLKVYEDDSKSDCFAMMMHSKKTGMYMVCAYDDDGYKIYEKYTNEYADAEWFFKTAIEIVCDYNELVY